MDFRKTYYILPNLFTLSSALCGFVSISLSASGHGGTDLYLAALAICFGFFFDTFDGRVARLTKTQTDLGRDLDSLADVITFGVAPALLVYKWGLASFGRFGIFVAGLYLCAATMRLARFNVLSRREEANGHPKPGKFILGLTTPVAAAAVVSAVLVTHNAGQFRAVRDWVVALLVLVLSYLMVSRVRFRSFKDVRLTKKTVGVVLLVLGSWAAMRMNRVKDAFVFMLLIATYIALGLSEEIIFFQRRVRELRAERRRAAQAGGPGAPDLADGDLDADLDADTPKDEDVLAELGAFDEDVEDAPDAPAPVAATVAKHGSSPSSEKPGVDVGVGRPHPKRI